MLTGVPRRRSVRNRASERQQKCAVPSQAPLRGALRVLPQMLVAATVRDLSFEPCAAPPFGAPGSALARTMVLSERVLRVEVVLALWRRGLRYPRSRLCVSRPVALSQCTSRGFGLLTFTGRRVVQARDAPGWSSSSVVRSPSCRSNGAPCGLPWPPSQPLQAWVAVGDAASSALAFRPACLAHVQAWFSIGFQSPVTDV